jgi:hypothetical protein
LIVTVITFIFHYCINNNTIKNLKTKLSININIGNGINHFIEIIIGSDIGFQCNQSVVINIKFLSERIL